MKEKRVYNGYMDAKRKNQFSIGQAVVYPQQGLGVIKAIRERVKDGVSIQYYAIYLEQSDMTLLIPVDRARELGVRPVVSRDEAKAAIASMSGKAESLPADWKLRYARNQELIKSGTIASIAKVVQSLYHRSKIKELPVQERKLYDNALELLIDEASIALRKDKEEISTLILSQLEK